MPTDDILSIEPGTQGVCEISGSTPETVSQCLLYRPRMPDRARLPVLLYLHGRGEARRDKIGRPQGIDATKRHGAPSALCAESGWDRPFLVVAPQLPEYASRWHEPEHLGAVETILDEVMRRCGGDEHRVYATGFSIGGLGALALAAAGHRRYAALVVCDPYDPAPRWSMPAHACADPPPVLLHRSERNSGAVALVRRTGAEPESLFPAPSSSPHVGVCRETFAAPQTYAWLLQHAT